MYEVAVRRHAGRAARRWPAACPAARRLQAVLLGGAAGAFVGPDELDLPLTFEGTRAAGATLGSGVVMVLRRHGRPAADPAADRGVLPRRVVRPVRALPGRHRPPGGGAAPARLADGRAAARATSWRCSPRSRRRCATPRSAGSARRRRAPSSRPSPELGRVLDRQEPHERRSAVRRQPHASSSTIDGEPVRVPRGRDHPRRLPAHGIDDPHALLRRDAHAGQRLPRLRGRGRGRARARAGLLAQSRGRAWSCAPTPTASATARKMVLELLGSSVDLSTAPAGRAVDRASTARGPSASGRRRRRAPGRATPPWPATTTPDGRPPPPSRSRSRSTTISTCATTASASSATSASRPAAPTAQNTFAIAVAGRGFDARISTEFDVAAARLGLRLLRQLHRASARPAR